MNGNSTKISIIVPVFNVELYIERCLESIISQSYEDLEIIVIDDGSTDNSGNIIDEYALKDERIKVKHISNQGVSNARNIGLEMSTGDYIGFIDGDDWVESKMYESLIDQLKNKEYDIIQCKYDFYFEDGRCESVMNVSLEELNDSRIILASYLNGIIYQSVFSKIYKRSLIENLKFDVEYPVGEDTKFIYECCKEATSVKILNDVFYHYFIRSTSVMNGTLKESHFLGLDIVDLQLKENTEDNLLYELCIKREVILCMDLIYAIIRDKVFENKFMDLRKRVIRNIKVILTSEKFSIKFKMGIFLLWLSPKFFKKIYIYSR